MTEPIRIDESIPKDDDILSTHPKVIRDTRHNVNEIYKIIEKILPLVYTELILTDSHHVLVVGEDLSVGMVEVIRISGIAPVDITNIIKGDKGQVKIFIAGDNDVTWINDYMHIRLNQPQLDASYNMKQGDIICLVNLDGISELKLDGVWHEIFRQETVGDANVENQQ